MVSCEDMGDIVHITEAGLDQLLRGAAWRPISLYDKNRRPSVLLRGAQAHHWTCGYWGVLEAPWLIDEKLPLISPREPEPYWRKAIDWDKGLPGFDPVAFAVIDGQVMNVFRRAERQASVSMYRVSARRRT